MRIRHLIILSALSLTACPGAIGKALRKWGYNELRPASTLMAPGTLVNIISDSPFQAAVLCEADKVLGPDFRPIESYTPNADISRINKKGVTLDVGVADIVTANNELHDVKSVKMTLTNVKVFEVSDYQLEHFRQMASGSCLRAVQRRQKSGARITMISSAIQADLVASVSWDRGTKLSNEAKVQAVSNLSVKLGIEASRVTEEKIEGKGLFWGIRDDAYMAFLFMDPDLAPPVMRDTRVFPKDFVINAAGAPGTDSKALPAAPGDPNQSRRTLGWDGAPVDDEGLDDGSEDGDGGDEGRDPPPRYVLTPADDAAAAIDYSVVGTPPMANDADRPEALQVAGEAE